MNKIKSAAVCAVVGIITFTGCKKEVVEKDLGPAETIKYVSSSLAEGKTEEAYVCLPKSYRKDISDAIHKIGAKMPPEVWDKSFELAGRLGKVLKSKQNVLAQTANQATGSMGIKLKNDDMGKSVAAFGDVLLELSKSDIAKVSKMKDLNVQDFVGSTGPKIFSLLKSNPLLDSVSKKAAKSSFTESLKKVDAKVVSEKGSTSKVKVTGPDGKTQEIELTKVEGKWIPKELADKMKTSKEGLKQLDEQLDFIAKNKKEISNSIKLIETFIVALEKANNSEDVMKALQNSPAGMMFMGGMGGTPQVK
jgi:hypothetical protein